MLKILFKAAVLFLIVISVYLIVNPHACSNMLAGRVRTLPEDGEEVQWRHPMEEPGRTMITPSSSTISSDELLDEHAEETPDTPKAQPIYSQEDIDYAIASRYVELERERAGGQDIGKDMSRELSYIVMQDFEMTPQEWDAFLARATASGLFEKVRQAQETAAANITTAADAVADAVSKEKTVTK